MQQVLHDALYATGGEIQAMVQQVGADGVAEADLRSALRRAMQMELGTGRVRPEVSFGLAGWSGRVGAADLAVEKDGRYEALVELKWARRGSLYDVLWDVLKMASAKALSDVEAAYVVVAAPESLWTKPDGAGELFRDRTWPTAGLLLTTLKQEWGWLLAETKARPLELPQQITTQLVGEVPIHVASGLDWRLRAIAVEPRPGLPLTLNDGLPGVEEGEPPSPDEEAQMLRDAAQADRERQDGLRMTREDFHPTELELTLEAGMANYSARLSWADHRLVYEASHGPPGHEHGSVRIEARPNDEQWLAFWQTLDEAGAWTWRDIYLPTGTDGLGWSLTVQRGARSVSSGGMSAYPPDGLDDPSGPFQECMRAFNALVGHPIWKLTDELADPY